MKNPKPVEFNDFYNALKEVKRGKEQSMNRLKEILLVYTQRKDSESLFEDIGRLFCNEVIDGLISYYGINELEYILNSEKSIKDYLIKRNGSSIIEFLKQKLEGYYNKEEFKKDLEEKWKVDQTEILENIPGLIEYIIDGIIEIIN